MSSLYCLVCGKRNCQGHTYSFPGRTVTDNTAVIHALEKRVEELEKVAEAVVANNVKNIVIKYAKYHPQWRKLVDALKAAGYLGGGE